MPNVIGFLALNGTPHVRNRDVFKGEKHDIHQVGIHIGNITFGACPNEVYVTETGLGEKIQ